MSDLFIDALDGLDAQAGTEALPKKAFPVLLAAITRNLNQNFWMKAGRYYDVPNVLSTVQGAHMRFRRYGTGGNPCIDARNWIAPGSNRFTLEGAADKGGFVWSIQIGTASSAYRVWSQSTNNGVLLEQRTVGEALRHVPNEGSFGMGDDLAKIKATLSDEDTWYGAGAGLSFKIYIWTKDQVDPADYWKGLSVCQSGLGTTGVDYAFNITRTQDLIVSGIDVFGTRAQNIIVRATDTDNVPCTNIVFEDCYFGGSSFGIAVRQATTATGLTNKLTAISDVLLRRCVVDVSTSAREQEPDNLRYGRLAGSTDLWLFTGRIDNVRAENCASINGNHSGFTFGAFDANSSWPRRTGFRRHTVKADVWNTYARGAGVFLCEDSCYIESCKFDGMNVWTQLSGSPLITSLVVTNSRRWIRDPNTDGHISISGYISDRGTAGIGNEKYLYNQPVNVRLVNCSFCPSYGVAVELNSYQADGGSGLPKAALAAGTISFENTVFMDNGQSKDFMTIYYETGLVVGTQKFNTLSVYKGESIAVPTVTFSASGVLSTFAIDTVAGFTNILTADPKVDTALRPKQGSPLIGAATPTPWKLNDVTGRRRAQRTAIGAYEDFNVYNRPSRA